MSPSVTEFDEIFSAYRANPFEQNETDLIKIESVVPKIQMFEIWLFL